MQNYIGIFKLIFLAALVPVPPQRKNASPPIDPPASPHHQLGGVLHQALYGLTLRLSL